MISNCVLTRVVTRFMSSLAGECLGSAHVCSWFWPETMLGTLPAGMAFIHGVTLQELLDQLSPTY